MDIGDTTPSHTKPGLFGDNQDFFLWEEGQESSGNGPEYLRIPLFETEEERGQLSGELQILDAAKF